MPFERGNKAWTSADHSKRKIATQQLIAELNEADKDGVTRLRRIVRALIDNAEGGDTQAIREVFDRVQGKPAQAVVGDDTADPIRLLVGWERDDDGQGEGAVSSEGAVQSVP